MTIAPNQWPPSAKRSASSRPLVKPTSHSPSFCVPRDNSSQPPTFRLKLRGTGVFSKVTIIKDDTEVKVIEPNQTEVELTWADPQPATGKTSYYYARGEQADGELVWVSPMWVTYNPGK